MIPHEEELAAYESILRALVFQAPSWVRDLLQYCSMREMEAGNWRAGVKASALLVACQPLAPNAALCSCSLFYQMLPSTAQIASFARH